jgi:chemotaxis protein methyltransferase CheR
MVFLAVKSYLFMHDVDIADLKRISDLIYERYNYDFRNYAVSSFRRRVVRILELKKLSPSCLVHKLIETPPFIHEFVDELTVNVTEMFRDPAFWIVMRRQVLPALLLERNPLRIWHAGCSSGEEVLTMCILLKEMGALDDVSITATDLDLNMLGRAMTATCPLNNMPINEKNYQDFDGAPSMLRKYYEPKNGKAVFDRGLYGRVAFLRHDLVTGDVFDKFDLILCRNVMIYFNQTLQNDVLKKLHASLNKDGYLSIGSKESLIWCDYGNRFVIVNSDEKIYRKIKE